MATETPGPLLVWAVRGRFDARFHDLRNDHQFYDLSRIWVCTGPARHFLSVNCSYPRIPTKDNDIVIAVGSEKLWRRLGPAIGHAELVDHPAYATNSKRVKNRVELESFLAEIFCTDTNGELASEASRRRHPGLADTPSGRGCDDAQCEERELYRRAHT